MTILLLVPGFAFAQETAPRKPDEAVGLYPKSLGVEYFCTDSEGARVELGQVVCITASCLTWTARCEMAGNNNLAMWRKVQDGCPGVAAEPSLIERIKRAQPPV